MIKPTISFERFLEIFMPGAVFAIGAWYLHRPFLLKCFPYVAADPSIVNIDGASIGIKTIIFIIVATCFGLFICQMSDIAIVGLVEDAGCSDKSTQKVRKLIRLFFRIFVYKNEPDCRVLSIIRYLNSPRKERFLRMIKDWVGTDENQLSSPTEAILSHQHIVTRMKALSKESKTLIQELHNQLTFTASLFTSIALLFPTSLLSLWTSNIASGQYRVHSTPVLFGLSGLIYIASVISNYSLRRQFRKFCFQSITLAIHCYEVTIK